MRKYTQKALRELCRTGYAVDITDGKTQITEPLERVGISTGIYGMNGGLLQGRETGRLYAITARNSELFRHF